MANSRKCESPDPLRDRVADCLSRHLSPSQHLTVGFSGGRDSVALLHIAHGLQATLGFQLTACHVNHRISPQADEWQNFCGIFCDRLSVPLRVMVVDVPRGSPEGLEAAARAMRYAAFGGMDADWLLLGQHRGDQAETMLFNLLRGAGVLGASGMPEMRRLRRGMKLLRPLLRTEREEIDAYLKKNALPWVEDESNASNGFSRNFLRHEVMPLLQSRFPAAVNTLAGAANRFAEATTLLDELAQLDLGGLPPHFPLPVATLTKLTEPRGRNLLRFLLLGQGARIPSEARLTEALRQLLEAGQDKHPVIHFGGRALCRRQGMVYLESAKSTIL
ncbi:MAG: tRNA lysidine(34) synthetase TilS [Rhodocyclaceae bacterium]|nr:MAG: tRNA lysidine(34) synthetase TilS [Rhodocyclaceae bacterium]